ILAAIEARDVEIRGEEGLQRDRGRGLAGAYQRADVLVDLLVQWLEEVLGLEEVGDAIERLGIDEGPADQRLLDLHVVRSGAKQRRIFRRLLARSRFQGHDGPVLLLRYLQTRHARLRLHICAHSRGAIITTWRAAGRQLSTFPVIQTMNQSGICRQETS